MAFGVALLFAPGAARAADDCGAVSSSQTTASCTAASYTGGIQYTGKTHALTVNVPGAATAQAITSKGTTGWGSGISADGTGGNIVVSVGGTATTANVNIGQATNTFSGWNDNHGIIVRQQHSGAGTTTVNVHGGGSVAIGTSTTRMKGHGINVLVDAGSGAATVASAATIYSVNDGIRFRRDASAATTAASTVTNSGAIDSMSGDGIEVDYRAPSSASNNGAVKIVNEATGTIALGGGAGNNRAGIQMSYGGYGAVEVDNRAAITGTARWSRGIRFRQQQSASSTASTLTNSGTITVDYRGIEFYHNGAGAVTVTNSGAIVVAATDGIGIWMRSSSATTGGAITLTNSGAITSARDAIFAEVRDKDGAGADAGISVTHSAGAIATSAGAGIRVLVGRSRQEADPTHGDYEAPVNVGLAKVAVTGGSIMARENVVLASNYEAGGVDITIASGVTATSTHEHGIYAELTDVGNTAGGIAIDQGGALTAAKRGIHAERAAPMGSGAISIENSGTIMASTATGSSWEGIYVLDKGIGDVTVTNSGAVTTPGFPIALTNEGGGDVSVDNSGALTSSTDHGLYIEQRNGGVEITRQSARIRAKKAGISVERSAGSGAVAVTNSGAIEAYEAGNNWPAIRLRDSGAGAVTVTNSGALGGAGDKSFGRGIDVEHDGASGDVTVVNSGDIATREFGIFAQTTGKDAARANAGVTVTHSGSVIGPTESAGIRVWVGEPRPAQAEGPPEVAEEDAAHGDYVRPVNEGLAKIVVTGGSIVSAGPAVNAVNYEAGGVEIDVSAGVTLTSTGSAAIRARLADPNNARGGIRVVNAGTLGATMDGISVERSAGAGAVSVANSGAIAAGHHGLNLRDFGSGDVAVTNSGAIGLAGARVTRGLSIIHHGRGTAGDVTVTNSGAIQASDFGIFARTHFKDAAGANAGVSVTHSGGAIDVTGEGDEQYGVGISARVGHYREENDASHDDYVAPVNTGLARVAVTGGSVRARGIAVEATNYEAGSVEISIASGVTIASTNARGVYGWLPDVGQTSGTITMTNAGTISARLIAFYANLKASNGDGSIVNSGSITSTHRAGIWAHYDVREDDNGRMDITVAEGGSVTAASTGVHVRNAGLGDVEANSERGRALFLGEDVTDLRNQHVTVHGTVQGGAVSGVHLLDGGTLLIGETGKVLAGSSGVGVLVDDDTDIYNEVLLAGGAANGASVASLGMVAQNGRVPGEAIIVIHGEVRGSGPEGAAAPAAVHLVGGGSVTVGPRGKVDANGAQLAIRGDNRPTRVTVQVEGPVYRETADAAVGPDGRVSGGIGGAGIARDDADRPVFMLRPVDDEGMPTGEGVERVLANDGSTDNSDLPERERPVPPPPPEQPGQPLPADMFDCDTPDARCHLYEALPSVLLAMNGLPTRDERMAAARSANGGWARVEAVRGEWKADGSTQAGLTYDHSRTGLRAGVDVAVGENARIGVAAHGLDGSAKMAQGKVELTGVGLGVNGTTTAGDFYVDAQAAMTLYDVDISSATRGRLKEGAKGTGHAVALEAGRPMAFGGGLSLTPRAGLAWSRVSMRDFVDTVMMQNTAVSVKKARSLEGRAGVLVEVDGGDDLRLFGSADLTREFSKETETRIVDTALKASAAATGVRIGLGGTHSWDEGRYALRGSARYAARGGANGEYGVGLSLAVRF